MESSPSSTKALLFYAIVIFASLSIYCAVRSEGFIAADACTHYLYSRFAFREPERFVDVWARPLITALYAIPAALGGRIATRLVSLCIAIGCGWVAMAIARGQKLRWPALALMFTLGQPMLFVHSFGEMTELPFALLLGLAFLAYQRENFLLGALLVSWTPLVRPEGFGFVALMGAALLFHHRLRWIPLLAIPLLVWDLAGWLLTGRTDPWWRWLADAWPYAAFSVYGRGNLLTFVAELPIIVSPFVLPATLLGIGSSFSSRPNERESLHLRLCRVLTAALPLFVLIVHSLLYWSGKLASFGEARYLLVVAPFWGVLSARGWEWAFMRFQWKHPFRWAGAAVLIPPIVANVLHPVVPMPLSTDWKTARNLAEWYRSEYRATPAPRIMAAHPGLFYYLDLSPCDLHRTRWWKRQMVAQRPADTLLIWDPVYGDQNSTAEGAITLEEIQRAGWIEIRHLGPFPPSADDPHRNQDTRGPDDPHRFWHVFVSR